MESSEGIGEWRWKGAIAPPVARADAAAAPVSTAIAPVGAALDGELAEHYETVTLSLLRGRVTPVLGAGASLFGRGASPGADVARIGAPSAHELAEYLARVFRVKDTGPDLLQVAQWVYARRGGSGLLYDALHEVFAQDFPPTPLHDFLASVPRKLRAAGRGKPPLIVTTNYDDLIEKALDAQEEEYDVVVYMAEGQHEGSFCHVTPDGAITPIATPGSYLAVDPDRRTVVLKMHGFVCRGDPSADSYVITEDHYIEYLTRTDLTTLLPKPVMGRLLNCQLLFLGYSLRDWNFRAILYQIYRNRLRDNDWWAVQVDPDELEQQSWRKRNVKIMDLELERYIPALDRMFSAELSPPPDEP